MTKITFVAPSFIGSHLILIRPLGILAEGFVLLHLIKEPDKWVYCDCPHHCLVHAFLCDELLYLHNLCFLNTRAVSLPKCPNTVSWRWAATAMTIKLMLDCSVPVFVIGVWLQFFCITLKYLHHLFCCSYFFLLEQRKKYSHQVFLMKNASSMRYFMIWLIHATLWQTSVTGQLLL